MGALLTERQAIDPAPRTAQAAATAPAARRAVATPVVLAQPVEYRCYGLAGAQYGVGILEVPEIRSRAPLARIDSAQACSDGLISLRGGLAPVVDLRLERIADDRAPEALSVTVVLDVARRVIGVAVASVADSIRLASSRITPAPTLRGARNSATHLGLRIIDEFGQARLVIVVDIEALVADARIGKADLSLDATDRRTR